MPSQPDISLICRSVFAACPGALLLIDERETIVLANPAATELLGYAPGELIAMRFDHVVPAGTRERPVHASLELSARRKDGRQVMVEITLAPLEDAGAPLLLVAIRAVGEHVQVRQALRRARYSECVADVGRLAVDTRDPYALLNRVPAAAASAIGADTSVLWRLEPNQLALRVVAGVGLVDEEAEGALMANRVDTPPGFALAEARPIIIEDYRQERRFDVPHWLLRQGLVSGILVPLRDRGRTIGVLALRSRRAQHFGDDEVYFLRSLVNLLSSSLQRAESEEALAHAQRLQGIGRLTGSVAHDFNNLLTVIQGNLQMLAALPALREGDGRRLVAAVTRASQRGTELTGRLLAFSRRQTLRPARVDVAATLHALADMLHHTLDPRIRITVDVAPACPPCRADPGQLESALLNIAINARDAMSEGGLLAFSAAPAAGDCVAITITDTGCGMSALERERAFEPFFTTKETGRGTGLGLSTVHGFILQSGGSVDLASEPGRGTTVTLRLPSWHESADVTPPEPDALPLPPGLRVLLVEDEDEVRELAHAALVSLGCTVTANADAAQALITLEREPSFDLLVSDIELGDGMRGTELARQATQRNARIAVLLVSGLVAEASPADASRRWERLRKPCTRGELARALSRALAARRP
ncbi:MAG: GAF domain-containing protein [Burkholderiaceae bacterium]|nr:MAG: GAF domain-containing protein [Burkholderiaceae bacterium]